MSELTDILHAKSLVRKYFKYNQAKTTLWFTTKNPLLGGVSPLFMIYTGRIKKLLAFIENQLEGNKP